MKARKVEGLDPRASFRENAARIVDVRVDELCGFAPTALEEENAADQHHMRIAAKRLRYILEITEPCFGEDAETAPDRAKDLQGILGDLHDCDVMLPRVEEHMEAVRETHPDTVQGLEALAQHLTDRRHELFEEFREFWASQERDGTWERLRRESQLVRPDTK